MTNDTAKDLRSIDQVIVDARSEVLDALAMTMHPNNGQGSMFRDSTAAALSTAADMLASIRQEMESTISDLDVGAAS